jgi:hypothetical protein
VRGQVHVCEGRPLLKRHALGKRQCIVLRHYEGLGVSASEGRINTDPVAYPMPRDASTASLDDSGGFAPGDNRRRPHTLMSRLPAEDVGVVHPDG